MRSITFDHIHFATSIEYMFEQDSTCKDILLVLSLKKESWERLRNQENMKIATLEILTQLQDVLKTEKFHFSKKAAKYMY